ncbi:MAG: protoporphyrinogen oxidase [Anaerolineae bacterium]|nr:protoporphyrinogen oxidase [Anaerolineae bacterium]
MSNPHPHTVIIGGGISGLSTAWYLEQGLRAAGSDLHYTLLEAGNRWGGKILTETVDGFGSQPFIVEGGPDSFITQKPWALALARELGIGDRVLGTNDSQRKTYVLNHGRPTPLPDGVLLIVPTRFMPFVRSSLISPLGKLRMGMDLFIPRRKDDSDETLADFIRRRLGQEALDKIAEPLLSGIYNAEAERQSLLATFPRFRALETQHGSLIKGMLAARRQASSKGSAPKLPLFTTFVGGTSELVDTLVARLNGDLRVNAPVTGIKAASGGRFLVELSTGPALEADVVVLAIPAYISAALVRNFAPEAASLLDSIRYVSTGTISLAYRTADIPNVLKGFGLVIPHSEKRPINAITISSTKFKQRAPEGYTLLRVFFGGSRSPESMAFDDSTLQQVVRSELRALLGIQAAPLFERIYRWHNGNPQYDINHLNLLESIETALPAGLYLTGSPYRGVGIPDCVHQAQQTAEQVVNFLVEHPASH